MFHSILIKTIAVSPTIVHRFLVKLLRSPQKNMTHIHGHNITYYFVFICTYLQIKFTLFTYQDLMSFMQPGYFLGNWMFVLLQSQLLHHICGNQVVSSPTANHHLVAFSFDLAHFPEQSFPLSRFCTFLLRFLQDFVYHQSLSSIK